MEAPRMTVKPNTDPASAAALCRAYRSAFGVPVMLGNAMIRAMTEAGVDTAALLAEGTIKAYAQIPMASMPPITVANADSAGV